MNTDVPLRTTSSPAIDPATATTSSPNEPRLPDDPDVLKRMIAELLDALKKANHERDGVQHRLDLLLRRLYGPKAERFDPNQPWLLPEMALARKAQVNGDRAFVGQADLETAHNFMSVAERLGSKPEIIAHLKIKPMEAYILAAPSVGSQKPSRRTSSNAYLQKRHEFDPAGMFVNEFFRTIFGIAET
jgi:hypothetical protein